MQECNESNVMNKIFYGYVCKELVYADLVIFKQMFFDKWFDLAIWVILTTVVSGYIMPFFGLANFGMFQLGGVIAATGIFELYSSAIDLVADFEGDRTINYSLTLPIPSWLAIISKSVYYFIIYFVLSLLMLPVGKLALWQQFDLSKVCYPKLILALIAQSIFYACFVLWASSVIENMTRLGNIWARFIFPMWFMGGFQFSWTALYQAFPTIAYINLLNPMIYITEAVRVAILGQSGYINFWLCLLAILIISLLCVTRGMHNLKRRLDFV